MKSAKLKEIRTHIKEYAEGSDILEKFLIYLNDNRVVTFSCCSGHNFESYYETPDGEKVYYDDPMIGFYLIDDEDIKIANIIIDFFKKQKNVKGFADISEVDKMLKFDFHFKEEKQELTNRDFTELFNYLKNTKTVDTDYIGVYQKLNQKNYSYEFDGRKLSSFHITYNCEGDFLEYKNIDQLEKEEVELIEELQRYAGTEKVSDFNNGWLKFDINKFHEIYEKIHNKTK